MSSLQLLSSVQCFGGQQNQYAHASRTLNCNMQLSVYLPPAALAGQRVAAALGLALVMPDTSPRGEGIPTDENNAYDFGLGAGFYVDATQAPWAEHYRMYSYIVQELPSVLEAALPLDPTKRSISGHSMGGHGALTIALKNPDQYRAVSAFAPIVHPSQCPWGQKALGHYLGSDTESWKPYDTVELIRAGAAHVPMLVDQGTADNFLATQLKTELLEQACEAHRYPATIRYQQGYDHSYYFIASFIEEHLRFHAASFSVALSAC